MALYNKSIITSIKINLDINSDYIYTIVQTKIIGNSKYKYTNFAAKNQYSNAKLFTLV